MTASALDLFGEVAEMAASLGVGGEPRGQSAVAEAPGVRSDAADTFPAVAFDGGQLLRVHDGRVGEYSVPVLEVVTCALCTMPITGHFDLTHGACLVIQPDGLRLEIAHHECMVKSLGHRNRVEGWHERIAHADCAACGQPWDEHQAFGYETLVCPTWDGDAAAVPLYRHAPGHVGPLRAPWLVIAGEEPCGCNERSMEAAA
jgi:hypothetical protein